MLKAMSTGLVQSQLIIGNHNLQTTRATLEACGFLSSEVLSLQL